MDKEILHRDISEIVSRWKDNEGNLIMILHEIQNRYGFVPREVSLYLSDLLGVPLARIYEVLTFYHYFKINQPGKYKISVCMGTACYLKGAPGLLSEIGNTLNIKEGEATKDGLFQLEVVRCLGCCGLAPVITVNDKVFGEVKTSDITNIIGDYSRSITDEVKQ